MIKKITIFMFLLMTSISWGGGIVNNTGTQYADSIPITYVSLNDTGYVAPLGAGDSLILIVHDPGGTVVLNTAFAYNNARIVATAHGRYTEYCLKSSTADLLNGTTARNGVYGWTGIIKDSTSGSAVVISTAIKGDFQLYTTRDFNTAIDSSALADYKSNSDLDGTISSVKNFDNYTGTISDAQVDDNVKVEVGGIDDATISNTTFNVGAIDNTAIAASAISQSKIQDGALSRAKFDTSFYRAMGDTTWGRTVRSLSSGGLNGVTQSSGSVIFSNNSIGSVTNGVTLADGAITHAKIASNAIDSTNIAAGSILTSEAPNLDAAVSSRLAPIVSGRTLQILTNHQAVVSGDSSGNMGINWANISNPTASTPNVNINKIYNNGTAANNAELFFENNAGIDLNKSTIGGIDTKTGFALSVAGAKAVSDSVWEQQRADSLLNFLAQSPSLDSLAKFLYAEFDTGWGGGGGGSSNWTDSQRDSVIARILELALFSRQAPTIDSLAKFLYAYFDTAWGNGGGSSNLSNAQRDSLLYAALIVRDSLFNAATDTLGKHATMSISHTIMQDTTTNYFRFANTMPWYFDSLYSIINKANITKFEADSIWASVGKEDATGELPGLQWYTLHQKLGVYNQDGDFTNIKDDLLAVHGTIDSLKRAIGWGHGSQSWDTSGSIQKKIGNYGVGQDIKGELDTLHCSGNGGGISYEDLTHALFHYPNDSIPNDTTKSGWVYKSINWGTCDTIGGGGGGGGCDSFPVIIYQDSIIYVYTTRDTCIEGAQANTILQLWVKDSANPRFLSNAKVTLYDMSMVTVDSRITNSYGWALFGLPDAGYYIATVTKSGWTDDPPIPDTIYITANLYYDTLTMTQISYPSAPDSCTCQVIIDTKRINGNVLGGVGLEAFPAQEVTRWKNWKYIDGLTSIIPNTVKVVTDVNGRASMILFKTKCVTATNAGRVDSLYYDFKITGTGNWDTEFKHRIVPDSNSWIVR